MRIGFVQFSPVLCDIEANLKKISTLVEPADLLVLPELATTGYCLPDKKTARQLAQTTDGPSIKRLVEIARTIKTHLVVGFAQLDKDKLFNSSVLLGPDGVIGVCKKTHLFFNEPDLFEPGDTGFEVMDIGLAKIGTMICFDWAFPEATRTLALRGAQVIAHPANLVLPYAQKAMPVRCLENRVFAVMCNRWGTEGDVCFGGESMIIAPDGEILAKGPVDKDAVMIVNIDPSAADDKQITPRNHLFNDRRPAFYER